MYKKKFAKVWLWDDWPDKDGPDSGIDLAVMTHTGEMVAVQCKFSRSPDRALAKGACDSFIAKSEAKQWSERLIVWSGFKISDQFQKQIGQDRDRPLKLLTGGTLRQTNTCWAELAATGRAATDRQLFEPKEHQVEAIEKVLRELESADRAKLVMACGSGKTFTSQLLAERQVGVDGTVLYCVPSIALLGQTMRAWAEQEDIEGRGVEHKFLGVCSDKGTGKHTEKGLERTELEQLEMSVTTKPAEIAAQLNQPVPEGCMRTVFSTYQSLPQILEAQLDHKVPAFDLVLCDEAHRTTGVERSEDKDRTYTRPFQLPHEDITSKKRVYMTATPKVFTQATKKRATSEDRAVWAMDDVSVYGEQAYKLSFSKAIDLGLLSDYRVHIAQAPEGICHKVANRFFQSAQAAALKDNDKGLMKTEVIAQMIGLWNALTGEGRGGDVAWKTIVYLNKVSDSKKFAAVFPAFCSHLAEVTRRDVPEVSVGHVDGTMAASRRHGWLSWLDEATLKSEIRILSNAKCLSEGVDVPSLDALSFLQPKGSHIEIVQSVGRVIRKVPLKKYGHVFLPQLLPAKVAKGYDEHLRKDPYWKTTWSVLRALRSHDERLSEEFAVSQLGDRVLPERISCSVVTDDSLECFLLATDEKVEGNISGVRPGMGDDSGSEAGSNGSAGRALDNEASDNDSTHFRNGDTDYDEESITEELLLFDLEQALVDMPDQAYEMLIAGIQNVALEKVGDRQYWETWSSDAAIAYESILKRIQAHADSSKEFSQEIIDCAKGLQTTLGPRATTEEITSILAQYLVVRPVFYALFGSGEYFDDSPLSAAMADLAETVEILNLDAETHNLDSFYESVVTRAKNIERPEDMQELIKHLYEDFIKTAFPEEAKKYGVVYTPTEIVDFILRSVDWSLREELGIQDGIASEEVEILDPFAGTGTFLVRLIQNPDLLPLDKLEHKFRNNLHSNEIMALPYWATEVNMEQAYQTRLPGEYVPYDNGVLVDTFAMAHPPPEGANTGLQIRSRKRKLQQSNPPRCKENHCHRGEPTLEDDRG